VTLNQTMFIPTLLTRSSWTLPHRHTHNPRLRMHTHQRQTTPLPQESRDLMWWVWHQSVPGGRSCVWLCMSLRMSLHFGMCVEIWTPYRKPLTPSMRRTTQGTKEWSSWVECPPGSGRARFCGLLISILISISILILILSLLLLKGYRG
jgi:hypothetical protein